MNELDKTDYWYIIYKSESGDMYSPWFTLGKPTEAERKEYLHHSSMGCDGWREDAEEWDIGPGDFGSFLYVESEGPVIISPRTLGENND